MALKVPAGQLEDAGMERKWDCQRLEMRYSWRGVSRGKPETPETVETKLETSQINYKVAYGTGKSTGNISRKAALRTIKDKTPLVSFVFDVFCL